MLRRLLPLMLLELCLVLLPPLAHAEPPCVPVNLHFHAFFGEYDVGSQAVACVHPEAETIRSLYCRIRAAQQAARPLIPFSPTVLLLQPHVHSAAEQYFGKSTAVESTMTLAELTGRLKDAAMAGGRRPLLGCDAIHFIDQSVASFVLQPMPQHPSSPFYPLSEAGRRTIDLDVDAASGG